MPFAVTAVRRTSPIIFVVLTLYYLFVLRGQNNADDKNYRNITFPPLKKVADVREKKVAIIGLYSYPGLITQVSNCYSRRRGWRFLYCLSPPQTRQREQH